jgi:hypothetical protein
MAAAALTKKVLGEIETSRRLNQDTDLVQAFDAGQQKVIDVVKNRTQEEIMALPTEQRWAEYGKTYEEEQAYRASHDQNPDGTAKYTTENIIGGVIGGLIIAAGAVVTGGLILDAIAPAAASSSVLAEAVGAAAPLAPAAAAAPVAAAAVGGAGLAAPEVISAIVATTETTSSVSLLTQGLALLSSPSGGALVNALTGNNPSAAAAQQAASQASTIDKLSNIAEDALTTAQKAVLGQNGSATGNNNTTTTYTVPSWVWWIVGTVLIVPLFIFLLISLFRRKR